MCMGGSPSAPAPQATVDPTAERRAAEQEATRKSNEQLLNDARRKRQQAGVVATGDEYGASVLSSARPDAAQATSALGGGG